MQFLTTENTEGTEKRKVLGILIFLCLLFQVAWAQEPDILYLSWLHDPTTTMTIQWHTNAKQQKNLELSYSSVETVQWKKVVPEKIEKLAYSSSLIHTVELINLEPDTLYQFCFGEESPTYRFRTLPATLDKREVRFATAGDAFMYLPLFKKINRQIAATNPDFIIVGGDIAYAYGSKSIFSNKKWQTKRWQTFLREWKNQMVTSDGRLIPMLAVLGNHDIRSSNKTSKEYPFFQLFAMPQFHQAYRAYTFGDYLSLVLLDTGHYSSIKGEQTEWLRKTLKEHYGYPYRFAAYHVAAYPSVYKENSAAPSLIREHWVPYFEKAHIQVAFEHHNHAFKRTYPIKEARVDPSGVLYLGDGSWGVNPRTPRKPSQSWYLAKTAKINHFWLTTLTPKQMHLQALDQNGRPFDSVDNP